MAKITRVELTRKQPGSTYDKKVNKYITYRVSVRIGGKRIRQSGFTSRKAAETYVDSLRTKKAYSRLGMKSPANGSVRLEAFFNKRHDQITNHAEQVRARRIFDYFIELTGNLHLNELRGSHIQIFTNARLNDGVKAETVNREINLLSGAFSRASQLFPEELEDFERPQIPRPKFKRKRRERIISEREKDAILEQLNKRDNETDAEHENKQRIARMFHIAYLLGMAYKEVAQRKKTDYDGEQLRFVRAKTGTNVIFEWLPDEAHEVIRSAIDASDTEYIFTISGSTPKSFYSIMRQAVEAAGLIYGRDEGITFHSARHSFVTAAVQVADLKTVGSMSGHSDATMVMLYSHASPESRKRALQLMYRKRDLKGIFERVRSGVMELEEFEKLLS